MTALSCGVNNHGCVIPKARVFSSGARDLASGGTARGDVHPSQTETRPAY